MTKTTQDNDVTDGIGAINKKIGTKLSWSIGQDMVYHEKHQNNGTNRISVISVEYDTELSRLIGPCTV